MASVTETPGHILWTLSLCISYICVSAMLIRFNKFLMHEDRFPFAMALTSIHMLFCSSCCVLLYLAMPSVFVGLASCKGKRLELTGWFAAIGLAFAISLYTSNQAYLYSNVAFLQFMKEGNVIITFCMSCAVGLQVLNRVRCAVVLWVIVGSTLAVRGEVHFAVLGFAFQILSQFAECSRLVMGELLFRNKSMKLDPLTYTLIVAPACLVALLAGSACTWSAEVPAALAKWWPYLLPNAALAFVLNVLVAVLIKETSAVGLILSGIVKDIGLVFFSWAFFGELVTPCQFVSFAVTLSGVGFWSYMKVAPDAPAVAFAERLLCLPDSRAPSETTALLAASKA